MQRQRPLHALGLLAPLTLGVAHAQATPPAPPHASGAIPIAFHWADPLGEGRRPHALLVQVRIDGRSCHMQLDTGANSAVIWGRGVVIPADEVRGTVTVQAGPLAREVPVSDALRAALAQCPDDDSVGTLGNAFFEQGSLRLDLSTPALHYTAGSALLDDPQALPMRYARWGAEGGHSLVQLHTPHGERGWTLLDTGAFATQLAVFTREAWDSATEHAPLTASLRVTELKVPAWGQAHLCFRAAPSAHWTIDGRSPQALSVLYCPSHPFVAPEALLGVVGMAPFGTDTLVIDYVAQRWCVLPDTETSTPTPMR